MTTSNEHNNAPAVLEQELSALLTTSLPYMTPVGRARLGQDIAQLYSSVSAPAVPQGWAIKFEGNDISVSNDHMGCIVPHTETVDRKMPSEVLHALCRDLLAATPAPAPAQYKDSTPQLSVGESSFESWFESYNPANKGDKQRARDAYAAGMGDPLVAPAPAQDEPFGCFRAEPFGWTDCAEDDEGAIALYERPQEVGLTDEEIEAIAKKHMSTVGDHWSNEEAIRESHAEDFARDIIAALRAKGQS